MSGHEPELTNGGSEGGEGDEGGEGCWGGSFGDRLKDRCTEEGGCGGDGIWARMKGVHCGSQPTLPREERNPELLGCRCVKALLASPFEHCHTLRASLSVLGQVRGAVWS